MGEKPDIGRMWPGAYTATNEAICPKCGADQCARDRTDVGMAIVHGPLKCPTCGWCEAGPPPKDWATDRAQQIIDHAWAHLHTWAACKDLIAEHLRSAHQEGINVGVDRAEAEHARAPA